MIVLAYRHGMRTSEVCGLKLADVDMKNAQLTIRRLKGSLKTTQPLSDHQGEPLLSEKKALRAWLAERSDHPSAYVFTSQKSGRINRSQFYRIFYAAAEATGLPESKRHPHCLIFLRQRYTPCQQMNRWESAWLVLWLRFSLKRPPERTKVLIMVLFSRNPISKPLIYQSRVFLLCCRSGAFSGSCLPVAVCKIDRPDRMNECNY
jgi:hypothetical protein